MRKVIWCCAALALAAGTAVYLAAEQAARRPDSLVGRCVISTYQAGTALNPVYQLSQAAVGTTFEAVRQVMDHPEVVPTTVGVIPADPEPVAVDEPLCPVPCPEEDEPHEAACPAPKPSRVILQPEDDASAIDRPQTGGAEEADLVPPMPRATEDRARPPRMPYATDDTPPEERAADGLDAWWKLFQQTGTHCTDAGAEESEPKADGTPECQEDPHYDQQYQGCPYMGPCPKAGSCPPADHGPAVRPDDPLIEDKVPEGLKGIDTSEPSEAPPAQSALPRSGRPDERPVHREVDTTEFRPSDGNPIDFLSIPY